MIRKHVWHKGEWIDVTDYKRPPRVGPYIIRDTMDALQHPATGQVMDSKSAFRRATRDAGCVEIGDQAPATLPNRGPVDVKADIIEAMQAVKEGYTPPPLEDASAAGFTPDAARFYAT